jgi:hypothetical protein
MCGGITKEYARGHQVVVVSNRRQLVSLQQHRDGPALKKARRTQDSRNTPVSYQRGCFICRKYYTKPMMTSAACPDCGTPLCRVDRTANDQDRTMSCYHEHVSHTDDRIRCTGNWDGRKPKFPVDLMVSQRKAGPKT